MPEYPLNQTAYQRASQDTELFRKSGFSFWALEVVGAAMFGVGGAFIGYWLTPSNSNPFWQFGWPTIGGGVGVIVGFILVFIMIFARNLILAPYRQRNEARIRVVELEDELKKPKLFDVEWRTTSLGLPLNHREDGTWIASSAQLGPSPITITCRGDLVTVTRVTAAPEVRFIYEDGTGWMSTNAITVTPQRPLPASMRAPGATDFNWDVTNPSQWVLTGLPLPMAKDELLELPGMVLSISDATLAGTHFEKGGKCTLTVRLAIRTDKGSPVIPDLSIELKASDIKNVEWMFRLEEKKTHESND